MRSFLSGLALMGMLAVPALAQDDSRFGGFKHDSKQPIEITANALEVRQEEQIAVFSGEVVAGQGTLRLTADTVEVRYDENADNSTDAGAIKNLQAKGNVFISNGSDTAQGKWAEYDLDSGTVKMSGGVVLTQNGSAGRGESLVINLNNGKAKLEGRVSLVINRAGGTVAPPPKCSPEQEAAAAAAGIKCVPLEESN